MTHSPAGATADTLTIVLAQLNHAVGDVSGNANAVRALRQRHASADLILVPELQLVGYPPEDLVMKPALAERAEAELARLAAETADGGPAVLVGTVHRSEGRLYNAVALIDGGAVTGMALKHINKYPFLMQ